MNTALAHHRAILRYAVISFASFIGSSTLCILIRPDLFDHPDYGLSFFGSIAKTVVPYALGLLTTSWCLWRIAHELTPFKDTKPLRLALRFAAICLVGIVLTPMALAPAVFQTHLVISGLLALSQMVAVAWILCRTKAKLPDYLLGIAFYVSGVATILSGTWPGILGVYAIGEIGIFISELAIISRAALRLSQTQEH
jgi:hypothetical protein